jgi:hypothetical protein
LFCRRGGLVARSAACAIEPAEGSSSVTVLPGKHPDIFQQIAVIVKATLAD